MIVNGTFFLGGNAETGFRESRDGGKEKIHSHTPGTKTANIVDVLAGAWLPGSPPVRRRGRPKIPEKKACNNNYTDV